MLKRYIPTKWIGGKTIGTADVMNNIEEGINNVNDDLCEPSTSGDLLNENVNSFKVGTGSINDESKDFTNQMEQSIVTLNDIQGKTVKDNTTLLSREIFRLYSSEFPKITDIKKSYIGKSLNPTTGELQTNENYYVSQYINVEPNSFYLFENIDANICFYDANGNFISNYDNSHNNNMHIFGYYGLHRYSFYVTTPKNASTVRCTVHDNANPSITRVKEFYEPDITLRSLPNGVCDEIKDGNLIQRISDFYIDPSLIYYGGEDSEKKIMWFGYNPPFPFKRFSDTDNVFFKTSLNITSQVDYLNFDSEIMIHLYNSDVMYIYVDLNKRPDYKTVESIKGVFKSYPTYIHAELTKPIITPINISILTNSNETLSIDTPVPITCTHKVSLNTKSQIEELQEVVQKEKKSIWQKLKELTDVKFELNENGYLKLPSILGGLTIQWVSNTVTGNSYKSFGLPISFDNNVLYYTGTLTGEVPGNSVVTFGDVSKSGFKAKHTVNNNTLTFKAFFIGY